MVVNKFSYLISLVLLFSAELIAEDKLNSMTALQIKIYDLSYQQMNSAFDLLEKKSGECQRQESKIVLSPALFNTIYLPLEQWKTALLFLSFNAARRCEGDALWGNAVIALNRFKLAEKKFYGEDTIKTRYRQGIFCCAIWERKLKLEVEYLEIGTKVREELQNIAELQRPFNVLKTIDAVELWLN